MLSPLYAVYTVRYLHNCVQVHVDLMMLAVKLATALEPLLTVSVIMDVTPEEIAAGILTTFAPSVSDN